MDLWTKVKWSEAAQVAEAMELDEEHLPKAGLDPQSYFSQLVEAGDLEQAVTFLGHALPRYEAVAWAARLLERDSHRKKLRRCDQQTLDRVLRWLDDPSDEFRREAFEASEDATADGAERLLAMSVFLSGGSIAPVDLPAVTAPQALCGRLAAAAVVVAAHRTDDPAEALKDALTSGGRIAAHGIEAATGR
jgi:hypothetical protein